MRTTRATVAGGDGGVAATTTERGAERTLWLAVYVVLVLAPFALMAVAGLPRGRSVATDLASGLGFAALSVLALQLVMPSRARLFTAPFGVDVLVGFHRQMGLVALVLVVGHVVVLGLDDGDRWALLHPLDAPFRAQAAQVSTYALIVLVATSVARRRGSYERWRGLHVVLGVLLLAAAFAHVLGVAQYVDDAPIRWGVLALVVLGLAAVFHLRVARPFAATGAGRAYRLRSVTDAGGDAVTLTLDAEDGRGTPFAPGQFAWLKLADRPYGLSEHPFSYASSALHPERIAFTVKAAGDWTIAARDLAAGTRLLLDGPHGGWAPDPQAPGFLLIGAGIGITPVLSVATTLREQGDRRPLVVLHQVRDARQRPLAAEVDALDAEVHVLESGKGERLDRERLRAFVDGREDWPVLVCGPPAFHAITKDLAALGASDLTVQ